MSLRLVLPSGSSSLHLPRARIIAIYYHIRIFSFACDFVFEFWDRVSMSVDHGFELIEILLQSVS